ncbi:MAG: hypothetical protein DRP10_00025 [Candidatus Aenigmatarchaeota archaeon]|nr:MAG: hypothetical protein DRP10_00025 [Candidatus Aenigmarchaeota archaeon]
MRCVENRKMLGEIKEILSSLYYRNPAELEEKIREVLKAYGVKMDKIVVTGETRNLAIYFFYDNKVRIYTPFQKFEENPVLRKILPVKMLHKKFVVFSTIKKFEEFLSLPKVILINPYIIEKYPIPRLSLGVSILASYLRKYQKAQVLILDTQLGLKAVDIEKKIIQIRPDIIGVSCPHGQTPLVIKILDRIYRLKREKKWDGLVIIGNFIAASFPEYFLKRYPNILIARGEGENTMVDLIEFVKGKKKLEEISGIIAKYKNKILVTPVKPINMDDLPPPASDTVEKLAELRGALTHEWNRGCFWQCTFCPRHHKPKCFKGMSPRVIISQLKYFNSIMNKFSKLSRHLYIADEETIGGVDESETKRLIKIAKGIIRNKIKISFDVYTRIDQIYNLKMPKKWHVNRIKMWHLLKEAGLARVFVGVESGSKTQLMRYGKGITPEQSVMAIRLLSCIGVGFRLGFIMFDPLMSMQELIENILFLERDDALMKIINLKKCTFNDLFNLIHDKKLVEKNKLGDPLCTRVSYMLAQLEVLIGCNYIKLLKIAEKKYKKKLIIGKPDMRIGKIKVRYLNPKIGLLAKFSQEWIDRNFELMYAIKGLRKTARNNEERKLFELMKTHRKLSLDFIKSMVLIATKNKKLFKIPKIIKCHGYLEKFWNLMEKNSLKESLKKCLEIFLRIMEVEIVDKSSKLLQQREINDTKDERLKKAIQRWKIYNSSSKIIDE